MTARNHLAVAVAVLALLFGPIRAADARGGHSFYSSHSHGSRCVGLCYGVLSTKTGLPRNTYVHGYIKKDGTVVQPYTRSR